MFLITFWEVPGLKTWHYIHEKKDFDSQIQKNTKISIFIKIDLGLFKIKGAMYISLYIYISIFIYTSHIDIETIKDCVWLS